MAPSHLGQPGTMALGHHTSVRTDGEDPGCPCRQRMFTAGCVNRTDPNVPTHVPRVANRPPQAGPTTRRTSEGVRSPASRARPPRRRRPGAEWAQSGSNTNRSVSYGPPRSIAAPPESPHHQFRHVVPDGNGRAERISPLRAAFQRDHLTDRQDGQQRQDGSLQMGCPKGPRVARLSHDLPPISAVVWTWRAGGRTSDGRAPAAVLSQVSPQQTSPRSIIVQARDPSECCRDFRPTTARAPRTVIWTSILAGARSWPARGPRATGLHVSAGSTGLLTEITPHQFPPTARARPPGPRKERSTLRTSIVVLILVNIVLGIALLTPSAGRATIGDGARRCCRGEGPDAYCCIRCCWRGPFCQEHSDCRNGEWDWIPSEREGPQGRR